MSAIHPWSDPSVSADLDAIEVEAACTLCVCARDLATGYTLRRNANRPCKTASVIKVPILAHVALAAAAEKLRWNEVMQLCHADKVGGSGVLTQLTAGLSISIRDLCVLMTIVSDNTATNMVIDRVGVDSVNAAMKAIGLNETVLFRKSYTEDTDASREFGLGRTTPDDMVRLLAMLADGTIGSKEVSADIVSILANQKLRDGIPRGLAESWRYAGKTGAVDGVRNDIGILTRGEVDQVAMAVFCQNLQDLRWTTDNAGLIALGRVARRLTGALPDQSASV